MMRCLFAIGLVLAGLGAAQATAALFVGTDVDPIVTNPGSPFYPDAADDLTEC